MHIIDYYSSLTSRNFLYIDEALQQRIRAASLVFFGVGLSSNIVIQAVRLGFEKIMIFDGDKVELTNLNRQQYSGAHVGRFKVDCLKETCLAINPHCNIQAYPTFIHNIAELDDTLKQADIIINTIDCGQHYFDLIESARAHALVICPFNPGFSGFAICFNHTSCSSYEYFKTTNALTENEVSAHILDSHPDIQLLQHINMSSSEFLSHVDRAGYYPQISIGASLVSGLVNHIMISHLKGNRIAYAPQVNCINNSNQGGS